MRERLDARVAREAQVSLDKARGLIGAGQVFGPRGERLDRPAAEIEAALSIEIRIGPRYVSRGGDKLEAALTAFALDLTGRIVLDVGASTGGFSDCALQHGAARVYAVDVGYGQLAWKLRQDPRVMVLERTNIRALAPDQLQTRPDFFTVDCSFISLRTVLPAIANLVTHAADGIALIKPQFEAERESVERGGVVHDASVRAAVVEGALDAARQVGFTRSAVIPSPLLGPAGNREYLAWLRRG